ncbi:MAG: hypothetical protein Q8S31_03840 [Alphaproteobacteria bacterium]|nr:hypothetical protein [Alphaproteobacteria bacterium]
MFHKISIFFSLIFLLNALSYAEITKINFINNDASFETRLLDIADNQKDFYKKFYTSQTILNFEAKLTEKGDLTPDALEYWLFRSELIPLSFFNISGKLAQGHIQQIEFDQEEASFSKALFQINLEPFNSYFIKVYNDSNNSGKYSIKKLEQIADSALKKLGTQAKPNLKLPYLALAVLNGKYKNQFDKEVFFTIFNKAPGKSLDFYFQDYFEKNTPFEKLKLIISKFAEAIGSLQYDFAIDPILSFEELTTKGWHDDLQQGNIYYDDEKGITLIDYDDMANAIVNPVSIKKISNCLSQTLIIPCLIFNNPIFNKSELLETYKEFVCKYSSCFNEKSEEVKIFLIKEIINLLNEQYSLKNAHSDSQYIDQSAYNNLIAQIKEF